MDEDECKHGMVPDWCSACKEGPSRPNQWEFDYSFTAGFDGQCPECDLPIKTGQKLANVKRASGDSRYVHLRCAPEKR